VILLTTKDRDTADATAQKAIADGIDAGVLKTDAFKGLPPGSYLVFSGQYGDAKKAQSQVGTLTGAHPGAYARQIVPKP